MAGMDAAFNDEEVQQRRQQRDQEGSTWCKTVGAKVVGSTDTHFKVMVYFNYMHPDPNVMNDDIAVGVLVEKGTNEPDVRSVRLIHM